MAHQPAAFQLAQRSPPPTAVLVRRAHACLLARVNRSPRPALPCPCCSMEGATLSGRQCAYKILEDAQQLARAAQAAQQQQQAVAA